jgi:hypothetical protein
MSLFSWFSKKSTSSAEAVAQSSGLGHVDATLSHLHSNKNRHITPLVEPGRAANRKGERLERREQLYNVVRESLTGAGILSASYKFKVLSLDSRGRQYLIMMDVARANASEASRLAEIESLIAHNAKVRHDILVTAVYWRINEQVTAGLPRTSGPAIPTSPPVAMRRPSSIAPVLASVAGASVVDALDPRYEPLQPDEVAAFKQALESVATVTAAASQGEMIRAGRRNPAPKPTFEDAELDDRASPLSGTQYGDLKQAR